MINPLEIGLAFIEGVALIASPCILPVLPLMLSGSVEGGKARPFGITFGFVLSFSVFVLLSRQIVDVLHINPDILRNASLILLGVLGLVMLSGKLSQKFSAWTQGFADLGNRAGGEGFAGGMAIGALIGLVWTPCAGPILAAVLVQVIRQQTDLQSIGVTAAFAVGAALPMLGITLAGKTVMKRFSFLNHHTETVRKVFAVLILLSVAFMAFGAALPSASVEESANPSVAGLQDGLETPYAAPEFEGIQAWLNAAPLTMQALRGKVVLIDFWTYSCVNCVRTLPYITAWDKKYRDLGLVVIGVHAPEFEFEKDIDNIRSAMKKYGIDYPVAVDNRLATWTAYKNRFWPAHYLIDQNGRVVYTHFGEGRYDVTENNIRYLLGIHGEADGNVIAAPRLIDETPETYLGYARAERFSDASEMRRDSVASYRAPNILPKHHWALDGHWKIEAQKITSGEKGAGLRISFKAKKLYLVMGTVDGAARQVSLKLNGAPLPTGRAGKDAANGIVTVKDHALYELINQPMPDNGLLEITAEGPGVEMYAFTFGE